MPRFPTRLALALLGTLLCLTLAACASTPRVSVSPTATATTLIAPTATPMLDPTPIAVPAGWTVLDMPHFSLAYPPGWTVLTHPPDDVYPYTVYFILLPSGAASAVRLSVQPHAQSSYLTAYCAPVTADWQHLTFAGLPMGYTLTGEGSAMRSWYFVNAQGTAYSLQASDANADVRPRYKTKPSSPPSAQTSPTR